LKYLPPKNTAPVVGHQDKTMIHTEVSDMRVTGISRSSGGGKKLKAREAFDDRAQERHSQGKGSAVSFESQSQSTQVITRY
jgi:hypothetical protein